MPQFKQFLRQQRGALGLSRRDLGLLIGRSEAYINDLESPKKKKFPSFETLVRLVGVLSCTSKEEALAFDHLHHQAWSQRDRVAAIRLILSALNPTDDVLLGELPWLLSDELEWQAQLPPRSQIWVLSDILAEATSTESAERVALGIRKYQHEYVYFVPFSMLRSQIVQAVQSLRNALATGGQDIMREQVKFYRLSDCAFNIPLRIAGPLSNEPDARYSIQSQGHEQYLYYPVPPGKVASIVSTLTSLLQQEGLARSNSDFPDPKLGMIELFFPPATEDAQQAKE